MQHGTDFMENVHSLFLNKVFSENQSNTAFGINRLITYNFEK